MKPEPQVFFFTPYDINWLWLTFVLFGTGVVYQEHQAVLWRTTKCLLVTLIFTIWIFRAGKFDISFKYRTCLACAASVSDSSGTTIKRFLVKPSLCRRTWDMVCRERTVSISHTPTSKSLSWISLPYVLGFWVF
jgi:hypothetical protein